jgi:hypothetical protein
LQISSRLVISSQEPIFHAYNPSYSGSRDQEDHGSKPVWTNSLRDSISEYPIQKRAGGVAQVVEHLPSKCEAKFKPHCCQKNQNKTKKALVILDHYIYLNLPFFFPMLLPKSKPALICLWDYLKD